MNLKQNALAAVHTASLLDHEDQLAARRSRELLQTRITEAHSAGANDREIAEKTPLSRQRIQQLRNG